jgi:carbamoyltransferase
MVIVPLPLYQHVEETADATSYQARFTELSREVGRQVIDPLPELKKYDKSTRRGFRFAKDVHLTPDGHAAVARAVAPGLREALGLGS